MNKQTTIETIKKSKIITIVRGVDKSHILDLGKAMLEGGINCMEITLDQKSTDGNLNTLNSISYLCEKLGERMNVGVGTAMTAEQVRDAAAAGAQYVISPNVCAAVIEETVKLGLVSIPGAMTPSEIASAYDMGADFVKVFPISNLGADYLKAVSAPLSHIPLLAVGGVSPETVADLIKAGACGFGVGGNIVNKEWISSGKFDLIAAEARRFRDAVDNATL
ncbi:MAG: bifunctional 4-hydroxy-2-oxoglutarate aldolase/2-dehydro-3-deoxy-phosphogluconate aldolase [Oscillospiraceae bacterium]|nr:bifunctional 4-hydroxy-2-oxoglutarate aldolase/2-dehydro-3-deoxy-phosphogluconate aldolase [Candidatus Equicaccousia limihippi]